MKTIIILSLFLCGCASGSPLDIFIPAKKAPLSEDYLGHLNPPAPSWWYFNLATAKYEQKLMDLRKKELEGEYLMVKGFNTIQIEALDPISDIAWAGLLGLAGAAGIMIPRPQEKAKIAEALNKPPPSSQ